MASREGSPNRNKQFLIKRLQEMYGKDFDVIINACENAIRMNEIANEARKALESGDLELDMRIQLVANEFNQRKECVNAWDKIAQYVTPKLKAMEIDGDITHKPHEMWLDIINGSDE